MERDRETFRRIYARRQALAEQEFERRLQGSGRDTLPTIPLMELAPEAPTLYQDGDVQAALRRDRYGFEVSGGAAASPTKRGDALSIAEHDSNEESFRLCGLADTLSKLPPKSGR
jgi:hypothetical protein